LLASQSQTTLSFFSLLFHNFSDNRKERKNNERKIIEKCAEDNGIYRSKQKAKENMKNALCLGTKSGKGEAKKNA
jgi:hypothetical protein